MDNTEKYLLFSRLVTLPRTGWVQRQVRDPESVAGHCWGCWLLAKLLLPENDDSFDKRRVLDLLLLHDAAEAVTGDIPRPVKQEDPARYAREEREAMEKTWFSGAVSPEDRELWEEWCAGKTEESRIAKDIDEIQAVALCLRLREEGNIVLEEADLARWTGGLRRLQTEQGKQIRTKLFPGLYPDFPEK